MPVGKVRRDLSRQLEPAYPTIQASKMAAATQHDEAAEGEDDIGDVDSATSGQVSPI